MNNKRKKTTNNKRKKKYPNYYKLILVIIGLVFFVVVIAVILSIFLSPERSVPGKIDAAARDYYENYLYENLINSSAMSSQTTFENTMQKYQHYGFGLVHLRQVLSQTKNGDADYITKYCDENKTIIKFYPDPPFKRTSYHIEYSYSCNF